jgi:hypothetical protein
MWHVFSGEIRGIFSPRLPPIPPRIHQQITITKHPLFLKPPSKTPVKQQKRHLHTSKYFFCKVQKMTGQSKRPAEDPTGSKIKPI